MAIYFEDKKLVKQLLAGNERAFLQFFDENFSRLYRFALSRLSNDPEISREVVQSTLAKAVRKIHTYRGESALFTWLCVICRNEMFDYARRNSTYQRNIVLTEDLPEIREVVESLTGLEAFDPTQLYQRDEVARLIQVALDKLPPKYGDALEWKYIEGYSIQEISENMNLSPDAVQSLLARAKKSFREIYAVLTRPLLTEINTQKT